MAPVRGTPATTSKFGTVISKCDCSHTYQTQRHGAGMRVMNLTKGGKRRCTVCSKVHDS